MTDVFVLRGFCKECKWPVKMDWISPTQCVTIHYDPDPEVPDNHPGFEEDLFRHNMVCEWFLSAKQMRIVAMSDEMNDWLHKQPKEDWKFSCMGHIDRFLDENPFLVASILKKAGDEKE